MTTDERRDDVRYVAVLSFTVLLMLIAGPAWAHPFFRPGEVPAGQQTEVELHLAHHCEQTGGASPTTVVAVQIPDAIAEVEPLEREGWTLDTTGGSDAGAQEFEWVREEAAAAADAEPPVFRLVVTPDTQEGTTTVSWRVFQGCEEGSYLWGGGSEDEPPVDMTITPGVYPAPAVAPTSEASPTEPSPTSSPEGTGDPSPTVSPATTATSEPGVASPTTGAADELDEGGGDFAWVSVLAAIAVAGIALVLWGAQRRGSRR